MIDHTGIQVSDFGRSKDFYIAALAPLGYGVLRELPDAAGFGAQPPGPNADPHGVGMRRIEATDIIDGSAALSTALLAASGPTLAVVQVISGANDPRGHNALVDRILAGK